MKDRIITAVIAATHFKPQVVLNIKIFKLLKKTYKTSAAVNVRLERINNKGQN